jgi:hypothetical protein
LNPQKADLFHLGAQFFKLFVFGTVQPLFSGLINEIAAQKLLRLEVRLVGILAAYTRGMLSGIVFASSWKRLVSVALCVLGVALAESPAAAASNFKIAIVWNQSSIPSVAGYNVHYGTVSHSYTNVVSAANTTNAVVIPVTPGVTYYFAATTFDASGNESAYSPEVVYTAPQPAASLGNFVYAAKTVSFNVSDNYGAQYAVLASTNLVNWVSIQTNTAPFTFVDSGALAYNKRFYRTVALQ